MSKNTKRHYDRDPDSVIERARWRSQKNLSAAQRVRFKNQLIIRDGGFSCFFCKRHLDWNYHIDHKIPVSMGGKNELANFVLACVQCNQEKHGKTIDGYREWLRQRGEKVAF